LLLMSLILLMSWLRVSFVAVEMVNSGGGWARAQMFSQAQVEENRDETTSKL